MFTENTLITYYTEQRDLKRNVKIDNAYDKHNRQEIKILSLNPYTDDRCWADARFVKSETNKCYRFILEEHDKIIEVTVSENHIFPVSRNGIIRDLRARDIVLGNSLLVDREIWRAMKFYDHGFEYAEIIHLEKIFGIQPVYSLEMTNKDSPYFTLSNGLITYNA